MNKNKQKIDFFFIAIFIAIGLTSKAQNDNLWQLSAETNLTISQTGKLPFWFRTNKYGSIPFSGTSAGFIGSVYKNYESIGNNKHKLQWSTGVQVRVNAADHVNMTFIEAYLKFRKGIFEATVGRTRDIIGIVDTALSVGAFSISGNALGIPKIGFAIPNYYQLPFFNKLFAIKSSYYIGYIGNTDIAAPEITFVRNAVQYYQQSSLYVRLGREHWKLKLLGGINHNVMYGNEQAIFGPHYTLNNIQATIYAAIGKTYHPPEPKYDFSLGGKVGNHVGSIDMAMQYEFNRTNILLYHQFIYDVGAIGHFANLADGISGISIQNKLKTNNKISWKKILIEFIATKDQAGDFNSKSPSGDEDYYNDFEFAHGWSYKGLNLGNALLASRQYTRSNLISDPKDYIINNRIIALHTGMMGSLGRTNMIIKLTYSYNYGTYGTAIQGHSTGQRLYPPKYGLFQPVNQFSGYLEGNKQLQNNYQIGAAIGADIGGLYYNSAGVMLKLKKTFY